jgi:AcrR family transcriptional regulator
MPSQKASARKTVRSKSSAAATAKPPRRRRGADRVAALMAAASEVFLEKGTEAATMTEIAARAGAAIGSLYQFFPTKEVLAEALHTDLAERLIDDFAVLRQELAQAPRKPDAGSIADRLFQAMTDFLRVHPVFIALADRRSIDAARKQAMRKRLRGEIAGLLALAAPPLPPARIAAMAVLILHLMRVVVAVSGESGLGNRARVLAELRVMLAAHLAAQLGAHYPARVAKGRSRGGTR